MKILNGKQDESYEENHPEIRMAFMKTIAIANLESVLLNQLENIEKAME